MTSPAASAELRCGAANALRRQPVRAAIQEGDLAHVVLREQPHQQAREAKAEAAVGWAAEAEEVEVVLDRLGLHPLVPGLHDELLVAVLALGTRRQLDSPPQQIEALGQAPVCGV